MSEPRHLSRHVALGDGVRLHVTTSGTGPPLVLLHGFTGSTRSWEPLAPFLDGFTTIAIDLPGHGGSESPSDPTRYALRRFADDLVKVLDAVRVQRAALLGYSLGGRAALHAALAYPDRVSALVLESTSPGIDDSAERAARIQSDTALAGTIERGGIRAFVDQWERLPLWSSQASLPDAVRARLRSQRLANQPRGLSNSLRGAGAGAAPSVLGQVGALRVPTLLVTGALDPKYTTIARTLEAAIDGARVAVIADAGHAVHLEQPAAMASEVTRFLTGVAATNGAWR
jgi:2-succinyl-6-hydroxy-2,4-cyclohexadiene-1-carboxylate synthase